MKFCCVGRAGLELLAPSDLPTSASQRKPLVKTSRMTMINMEKPAVTVDIGSTIKTVQGVNVTINCQVAGYLKRGQAWWLTSVIPALWEAEYFGRVRRVDFLRPGVPDQPSQHGETSSLLKIQKLARYGGECLQSQLLGRLRHKSHLNLGDGGCNHSPPQRKMQAVSAACEQCERKRMNTGRKWFAGPAWWLPPVISTLWEAEAGIFRDDANLAPPMHLSIQDPTVRARFSPYHPGWSTVVQSQLTNLCLQGSRDSPATLPPEILLKQHLGSLILNSQGLFTNMLTTRKLREEFTLSLEHRAWFPKRESIPRVPEVEVTWFRNKSKLGSPHHLHEGSLQLTNVSSSDQGVYTCRAANLHGELTESTQLLILDPPQVPTQLEDIRALLAAIGANLPSVLTSPLGTQLVLDPGNSAL
ncbi:ADAMTS-like protein 1, partial [Plecturocebus cupreus]